MKAFSVKRLLHIPLAACVALGFQFTGLSGMTESVQASPVSVNISLNNNTKAYEGTTSGMGGTVIPFGYHSSWQVKSYNDDDLAKLITQFKKTGSTYVRLWVDGAWFEPVNDNNDPEVMNDSGFTWNSAEMESLYKYIQAFKDAGVDVFVDNLSENPHVMYPWLTASPSQHAAGPNTGKVTEYAEHMAALIKQLCVVKGFTNVKYVAISGEPNYYFASPPGVSMIQNYKDTITALHDRLDREDLLQYVKLIAPEIGHRDDNTVEWLEDLSTNVPSSIDVYSLHSGLTKEEVTSGSYYNLLKDYVSGIKANDPDAVNKPFMITDYTLESTLNTGANGINAMALISNGLRAGFSGFGRWLFEDNIWTWPVLANQSPTGVGSLGLIGNKLDNHSVKQGYQATALMYKLIPQGSTTYTATTSNESVIPAMISTSDGKTTIVIVNWSDNEANISVTLQNSINTTFMKYQVNSDSYNTISKSGAIPPIFDTKTVNGTSFTDTIPANTVYYYSDLPDHTAPSQVAGASASSPDYKNVTLTWNENTPSDLAYYRIYRSETAGFTPSAHHLIEERWIKPGAVPTFRDKNVEQNKTYYYKISAVDKWENEGASSSQASVTVGGESYANTLTVTDSSAYDYYEVNSDNENGYKVRIYKNTGMIGYLQDALGYDRTNISWDMYTTPMAMNYSSGAYAELVPNGGAESGSSTPAYWHSWTSGGTMTWDSTVSHSGSKSFKMHNPSTSDNSTWYLDPISITGGKSYLLSSWAKTDNVAGTVGAGQGCYFYVTFLDAANNEIWTQGFESAFKYKGTNDWQYFSTYVTAPATAVKVKINAMLFGNSGTAWFDDLSLVEQPEYAVSGQRHDMFRADSVTYNNISADHKQIVTVQGSDTLYYDFYADRIEIKVVGTNPGGYYIEDGGFVQRNLAFASWSDGTEDVLSNTNPGAAITKSTTRLSLYQPSSPQTITYEFASSKSVSIVNGATERGYFPRFRVNSGEVYKMRFDKRIDNANSGAEVGTGSPVGWNSWNQSGHGTFTWDSSTYHWGGKSLKISNSQVDNSVWYEEVSGNIDPRRTYRLSGWLKTSSVSGLRGAWLRIEAKDASNQVIRTLDTPAIQGTTDWRRYEIVFNPPEGTAKFTIAAMMYDGAGTAWYDDIVLNYADNGFYNAGAEMGSGSSPANWQTWTTSGTPFTWDNTTSRSGKRSLKIHNTASQYSSWSTSELVNYQLGKEYEFGGWIKTSNVGAGSFGAEIEVIALDAAGNWLAAQLTSILSGTNDWTYVTGRITLPNFTQKLVLQGQLFGVNGTAWFDDMFIRLADKS